MKQAPSLPPVNRSFVVHFDEEVRARTERVLCGLLSSEDPSNDAEFYFPLPNNDEQFRAIVPLLGGGAELCLGGPLPHPGKGLRATLPNSRRTSHPGLRQPHARQFNQNAHAKFITDFRSEVHEREWDISGAFANSLIIYHLGNIP